LSASPAAIGAAEHDATFDLLAAIVNFVIVSAGGLGIGIGLGWLVSQLIARLDDYLIETTLLEYERRHGRLMAARAAHERVAQLYQTGIIAARTWESLASEVYAMPQQGGG
jgi:hypothetical protein